MIDRNLLSRTLLLLLFAASALAACDDGEDPGPTGDTMDAADVADTSDVEPDTTPVECDEATACDAPAAACDGVYLVTCAEDANGCLVETTTNCGFEGQDYVCDDSADPAVCAPPATDCSGVTTCASPMRVCNGNALEICAPDANGCLVPSTRDCLAEGLVCDESGAMPSCQPPDCDSECLVLDALSCGDGVIERCQDTDGDGCRELVAEQNCAMSGEFCSEAGTMASCLAHAEGRSCQQPIVVTGGFGHFTGDDLVAEFGDAHSWLDGTGCDATSPSDASAEVVFEVALETHDTLYVHDDSTVDLVRRVVETCEDHAACLASEPSSTNGPLVYSAPMAQTVYVVVETFSRQPFSPDYDITIEVEPAVCGNASVTPNEACDDGNELDGDGCSADCLTVETGYVCGAGFCYDETLGETCAAPIPVDAPRTFDFDTSPFADDYETYTACDDGPGLGPDAVFAVDLADNDVLDVAAPDPDFEMSLSIATGCPGVTDSCQSYGRSFVDGASAAYHNGTGGPQTVYVIADSGSQFQSESGVAMIELDVHPLVCGDSLVDGPEECDDGNAIDNDGCSSSCQLEGDTCTEPLTPPSLPYVIGFTTAGYSNAYDVYGACNGDGGAGPDRVYQVDVEAGEVLRATAANQDFNAAVVLSNNCPDIVDGCTAYGESSEAPVTLTYINNSTQTETWYVIFDTGSLAPVDGNLEATLDVYLPTCGDGYVDNEACDDGNTADNDGCSTFCTVETDNQCFGEPSLCALSSRGNSCSTAIALPGAGHYGGNTVLSRTNQINSHMGCPGAFGAYGEAADSVFSISLAANETLEAVLRPPADVDLGLTVVSGSAASCASIDETVCVAFDDASPAGGTESVSYTATAAETVYLIIDGRTMTDVGPFDIFVDVVPAP